MDFSFRPTEERFRAEPASLIAQILFVEETARAKAPLPIDLAVARPLFPYSRGRTIAAGRSEIHRNILADPVPGLPK